MPLWRFPVVTVIRKLRTTNTRISQLHTLKTIPEIIATIILNHASFLSLSFAIIVYLFYVFKGAYFLVLLLFYSVHFFKEVVNICLF